MNLGRMFGFAYGHKENGAVFCHMAVMYAYALYSRGFVNEGYRVLDTLKKSSMDFERSGIYPSIPEYFTPNGRRNVYLSDRCWKLDGAYCADSNVRSSRESGRLIIFSTVAEKTV